MWIIVEFVGSTENMLFWKGPHFQKCHGWKHLTDVFGLTKSFFKHKKKTVKIKVISFLETQFSHSLISEL